MRGERGGELSKGSSEEADAFAPGAAGGGSGIAAVTRALLAPGASAAARASATRPL